MRVSPALSVAPRIRIFIISWPGRHESAARVAAALADRDADVAIVYSGGGESDFASAPARLIARSNALFWADKFQACLDHSNADDILLIVHADCRCGNWPELVRRCARAFDDIDGLGVWSPKTRGTPYRLEKTRMGRIAGSRYSLVANTDGLVFALSPAVAARMRAIDYGDNLYGWGIDWAFVSFAHAHHLPVVVDEGILVRHPISPGYSSISAKAQMKTFLERELTPEELRVYRDLWDTMQARKRRANLLFELERWRGRWARKLFDG